MTRRVIATEGVPSAIDGVWLAKGSLWTDPDRNLPVTLSFDYTAVIGWAEDLHRDEATGEVTIDIQMLPGHEKHDFDEEVYGYTFSATDVVQEQVEATDEAPAHTLVTDAHVRSVAIVPLSTLRKR